MVCKTTSSISRSFLLKQCIVDRDIYQSLIWFYTPFCQYIWLCWMVFQTLSARIIMRSRQYFCIPWTLWNFKNVWWLFKEDILTSIEFQIKIYKNFSQIGNQLGVCIFFLAHKLFKPEISKALKVVEAKIRNGPKRFCFKIQFFKSYHWMIPLR